MKKYITILLMIVAHSTIRAQTEAPTAYVVDTEYNWWAKSIGDKGVVFADIAYIRDSPSTTGKILDSLTNGEVVTIISQSYNPSTIRGFSAPWNEIEYQVNAQTKKGFIWLGLLALGEEKNQFGEPFIFGVLKYNKETSYSPSSYLIEVKTFDKYNKLVDRASYPAELNGQSYVLGKQLSNMGLEGLKSIYRIGFLGEACGISSNHYYFGWSGNKIIPLFYKTSVSDAGVFYYEEKILFPAEHQQGTQLIFKDTEEGEVIDPEADDLKYKITTNRKKYSWDGKIISEIIELK